jgi:phosphoglycolate phosphatase
MSNLDNPAAPRHFPFRAVLFDFDGTLADSYPAITASVNHVRALHGLEPLSEPDVRRHVGYGAGHLLQKTVPAGDPDANAAAYRAHHPSVLRSGTRLLAGAAEVLQRLKARGLRLAVCSNKPVGFTRELLEILQVARFFDAVLGPEDVAHPKPAPDMLLAALHRLGARPEEALYVGDMDVDVRTARAAGLVVWVVPTGSCPRNVLAEAQPDRLLRDLNELRELLSSDGAVPAPGRS